MTGIQCRYLSSKNDETLKEKPNWKLLEKRIDHNNNDFNGEPKESLTHYIPGGGIAQKWWQISEQKGLNTYILIVFAHEGNNIPEAMQLVNYLNDWKNYLSKVTDSFLSTARFTS